MFSINILCFMTNFSFKGENPNSDFFDFHVHATCNFPQFPDRGTHHIKSTALLSGGTTKGDQKKNLLRRAKRSRAHSTKKRAKNCLLMNRPIVLSNVFFSATTTIGFHTPVGPMHAKKFLCMPVIQVCTECVKVSMRVCVRECMCACMFVCAGVCVGKSLRILVTSQYFDIPG